MKNQIRRCYRYTSLSTSDTSHEMLDSRFLVFFGLRIAKLPTCWIPAVADGTHVLINMTIWMTFVTCLVIPATLERGTTREKPIGFRVAGSVDCYENSQRVHVSEADERSSYLFRSKNGSGGYYIHIHYLFFWI
jgi:hypothetical protein